MKTLQYAVFNKKVEIDKISIENPIEYIYIYNECGNQQRVIKALHFEVPFGSYSCVCFNIRQDAVEYLA